MGGNCRRSNCQFRHTRKERDTVCKHWLRGLCKKGDAMCEYLHEYDMSKMPVCQFFSSQGECLNEECIFRHVDADEQLSDCPWYARGFCKHGKKCRHRHVAKEACLRYLARFCPEGPNCEFGHPKHELPQEENSRRQTRNVICRACHQPGHCDYECMNTPASERRSYRGGGGGGGTPSSSEGTPQQRHHRPLSEVICFKCKEMGHYANKCPNPVKRDDNFNSREFYRQQDLQKQATLNASAQNSPRGPPGTSSEYNPGPSSGPRRASPRRQQQPPRGRY